MNGANEAAVALFLEGKIGFNDISRLVMKATEKTSYTSDASLTNVLAADKSARENVAFSFEIGGNMSVILTILYTVLSARLPDIYS